MNFSSAIKLASIATERNLSSTFRATLDRSRSTRVDWTSSADITVLASAQHARNKTRATIVETALTSDFICSIYRFPHSLVDCIGITSSSRRNMFWYCQRPTSSFLVWLYRMNRFMTNYLKYLTPVTPGRGFSAFIYLHTLSDWLELTTLEAVLEL